MEKERHLVVALGTVAIISTIGFVYILIQKPTDPQTQIVTDKNCAYFIQKCHTFVYV